MTACFGDTSYYLAALIPRDAHHLQAKQLASMLRRPVITSEFVLLEVANYLSTTRARNKFEAFVEYLRTDPHTSIVPATSSLVARGVNMYIARTDKDWSLTDCISFSIMENRGITDALTADHHFQQAGFKTLM